MALTGVLMLTQAIGWGDLWLLAALHMIMPYLVVAVVLAAGIACVGGHHHMATTAALIGIGGLVLTAPVVFPPQLPRVAADVQQLTILEANTYVYNGSVDRAARALLAQNADVLVISEYTYLQQRALNDNAGNTYPYREEVPDYGPDGIAIWSRYPLLDITSQPIGPRPGIVATIDAPGGTIRVVAIHTVPPVSDLGRRTWADSLREIGDVAAASPLPTIIVGDFNASRWHPPFRDLLDRGWNDAHEWLGKGFSVSWMANGETVPMMVRLDHALFGDGVVPTAIHEVDIPGSDHRGFVVSAALVADVDTSGS